MITHIPDATTSKRPALSGVDPDPAWAILSMARCTAIGAILVHQIALAENSIFTGLVETVRRHPGCMRFCYVPRDSRTPRRYHCEPDHAVKLVRANAQSGDDVDALVT